MSCVDKQSRNTSSTKPASRHLAVLGDRAEHPAIRAFFRHRILDFHHAPDAGQRRRHQGGAMSFRGKFARQAAGRETKIKVTFADVAGCDEAKEEVERTGRVPARPLQVPEARRPHSARRADGRFSPGTGKTLLARAIAGEAKVPFFSISGSDFVEMFVGVGASPRSRHVRNRPRSIHAVHHFHRRNRCRRPSPWRRTRRWTR